MKHPRDDAEIYVNSSLAEAFRIANCLVPEWVERSYDNYRRWKPGQSRVRGVETPGGR